MAYNKNRNNDANRGAGEANAANTDKRPDDTRTDTKTEAKEGPDTTTNIDNVTDQVAARDGHKDVATVDPNSPTISGFTAENNGTIAPKETAGLDTIDYDKATNLRTALDNVIGYQTGSTYRHDFEHGLETLRQYGLTFNEASADNEAKRKQEEVLANEQGQVTSSNGNSEG
jgi:hypothetical protein